MFSLLQNQENMSSQSDVLKVHKKKLEKVKNIFLKLDGKISLSMDLQKDMRSFEDYVCVCAHFIDDDWILRRWVIKYCAWNTLESDHPTVVISKSLNEYDIERKLLTLTLLDDADEMAKEVKERVQTNRECPLSSQFFHVKACSDLICKMVQEGFEEIDKIIDKVKLLSWSNSMPLWYLTTYKLSQALKLEEMGEFSSIGADGFYEVPSKEEWEKARKMCTIADKIYEVTEGVFRLENPTSNLFLPLLQEIRSYLIQESVGTDEFVKHVALKMLKIFNDYWEAMYLVLSIAAFLDPRYKMKFVELCLSDDDSRRVAIVSNTIRKLYNDDYAIQRDQIESSSANLSSKVKAIQFVNDTTQKLDLELYMEEPVLPMRENFSVLRWWSNNCAKYPRLSRMARDFLAIPMSLATSYEESYNIEPREADGRVLSYKPEVMNAMKCIRCWKLDWINDN